MINRRQLLRGNFNANAQSEIRPPWSKEESLFIDLCRRCNACIEACPENIITIGSGKFPTLDFEKGECSFCHQCVDACQHSVFDTIKKHPWHIKIAIKDNCLSKIGVICRSCTEVCDQGVIKFSLQMGGVPNIELETDRCNGCGACVGICPKSAIALIQK